MMAMHMHGLCQRFLTPAADKKKGVRYSYRTPLDLVVVELGGCEPQIKNPTATTC